MSEAMFSALYRLMSQSDKDIEMTESEFSALQQKIAQGDVWALEQMVANVGRTNPAYDEFE